jgi:hypothetical protein
MIAILLGSLNDLFRQKSSLKAEMKKQNAEFFTGKKSVFI